VRTEYVGRTVACKHCSQPFLVEYQDDAQLPGEFNSGLRSGDKSVPDSKLAEAAAAEMEHLREQNRVLKEAAEVAHQLRLELQSCWSALTRVKEAHKCDLEKIAVITGERDSLRAEKERKDAEILALHAQSKDRGAGTDEVERWSQECAQAQAELRVARETVEKSQARASDMEVALAAAKSACDTIRLQAARDLEEAHRELQARLTEELEAGTRAEEQHRAGEQELQEENHRLRQEVELLRQQHTTSTPAGVEQQHTALLELQKDKQRLREEAEFLRLEFAASTAAATEKQLAETQRFAEEAASLRQQIQRLQGESAGLRQQQMKLAEASKTAQGGLLDEIASLRARHEELEASAAEERRIAAERVQGILASLEQQKSAALGSEQAKAALQKELYAAKAEPLDLVFARLEPLPLPLMRYWLRAPALISKPNSADSSTSG
jgi:hypothetical protein